ncbi:MAG: DHHW family protein [Bacilli bacterium]
MEKYFEKFLAITVSVIVLLFSAMFFINEKKTFSENENRYLTSFPKYSFSTLENGKYTNNIKDYLSDHFPFRDEIMGFKTLTYKALGINQINDVYLGKDGYLIEKFKKMNNMEQIIIRINKFAEKLDNTNIQIMLVPTSASINDDKLPKYAINEDQNKIINDMYRQLNITNIPLFELFKNKNNEYQLYYKLDHHWTSYGAYFAYLKYCQLNKLKPITIEQYKIMTVTNEFYGTLYSKTNDYSLKPDSIVTFSLDSNYTVTYKDTNKQTNSLYENSYLNKKDKYSYFLDNNHALIEITNMNVNNKNEVLIIKDSYANSFVPFLVNHYKKVNIIDPRYYKESISEYVKKNTIENILFLYNINTIDNDLGILSIK